MKIRCIAIDDEPLALRQMNVYIEQTPFLELAASCANAIEATQVFHELQPDLIFVDINMPGLSGMEFVKSLNADCMVIFTTAYSEYALEGFKVNAIDYLLKPFSYAEFLKAANKAKSKYDALQNGSSITHIQEDSLFVKADYRVERLKFNDILYIEGMREYVQIHFVDAEKKPIMSLLSIKSLEERLPKDQFMRIHRSFIVNLNHITTIERSRIVYRNNIYIPIGEQYKEHFQEYLGKHSL